MRVEVLGGTHCSSTGCSRDGSGTSRPVDATPCVSCRDDVKTVRGEDGMVGGRRRTSGGRRWSTDMLGWEEQYSRFVKTGRLVVAAGLIGCLLQLIFKMSSEVTCYSTDTSRTAQEGDAPTPLQSRSNGAPRLIHIVDGGEQMGVNRYGSRVEGKFVVSEGG